MPLTPYNKMHLNIFKSSILNLYFTHLKEKAKIMKDNSEIITVSANLIFI